MEEAGASNQTIRDKIDGREPEPDRIVPADCFGMGLLSLQRHPKFAGREGVVVGMGSPNSLRVKFDKLVMVQGIHRDYLVKAPVRNALLSRLR